MPNSPSPSAKTEVEKKPVPTPKATRQQQGQLDGQAQSGGQAETKTKPGQKSSAPEVVKKKKTRKRFKIPYPYFHLGVGLVGTIGLLVAVFMVHQKMVVFAGQLEEKNSQLVALQESSLGQQSLSGQYASVSDRAPEILMAFPNEETIIDFFKLFRQLVGAARVETFDFQTDQPIPDGAGNAFIEFAAQITGTTNQLETFLNRFAEVPYLVSFSLVDLEQNGTGEASLVLKAKLEVEPNFYLQQ